MELQAQDFVHQADNKGLSDQDKSMLVGVYDDLMQVSANYARFFNKYKSIRKIFFDLAQWHRGVVWEHRLNHYSVDYTVFIRDDYVPQIVMDTSTRAVSAWEWQPPPAAVSAYDVAIDSPYKSFVSSFPELSGYLRSEGMSKMLRKVWQFLYETRHRYNDNTYFLLDVLGRENDDVVCELRVR